MLVTIQPELAPAGGSIKIIQITAILGMTPKPYETSNSTLSYYGGWDLTAMRSDKSAYLLSFFGRTLGLVCVASLILAGCGQKDPPAVERPPPPSTVVAATSQDVPVYLDEVGRCVAREVVSVQPEVSGRITEIHFTDGADLKAGDPLFTIDPRPFQAQLNAAEANLAQSRAALDLAKIQFARVQDLVDSKAIATQDYHTRKNAVDVAVAQGQQTEPASEFPRLNTQYTPR